MPQKTPHDLNAECNVLSCILLDESVLYGCTLSADCFFSEFYRDVFTAITALQSEWKAIDTLNLLAKLSQSPYLEEDIRALNGYAITTSWFEDRCALLVELANRRAFIGLADKIKTMAHDTDTDFWVLMSEYWQFNEKVKTSSETKTIIPIETFDDLFEKHHSVNISDTVWFAVIDKLIRGYRTGSLYIIWARPSMWKSTLAVNMLLKAIKYWTRCALFSTEMPAHEIHIRVMSLLSKIEPSHIEAWLSSVKERVADSITEYSWGDWCNIYDDFDNFENFESLLAKEASLWTKIVFIDYLQQIWTSKKFSNLTNSIGYMTTKMKKLAIKYGMCIVCMAQLNREASAMREPSLKDYRDSWNIEQDADVCMTLHTFDDYTNKLDIYVLKNRHWPKWVLQLWYSKEFFYMYDV